jgi:hypothetical protein
LTEKHRLSDRDFATIQKIGGGNPRDEQNLRQRLEEIIEGYQEALNPREGFETDFLDFANTSRPKTRKPIGKLIKHCDAVLDFLADRNVRSALRATAVRDRSAPHLQLPDVTTSVQKLREWAVASLRAETRGRPADAALRTAILALAQAYIDHFRVQKGRGPKLGSHRTPTNNKKPLSEITDVWELPYAVRSHFIRFSTEILSRSDDHEISEEKVRDYWLDLRSRMNPLGPNKRSRRGK